MIQIPYWQLLQKHRKKIVWSILLFWLVMGGLVYGSEVIAYTYFGAPVVDPVEVRQYLLRWLLWLLFTPLIILIGLKINVGNTRISSFIILHICLATCMLLLEFSLEVFFLKPFAEIYYHRKVTISEMIVPFLYKYFAYVVNYFLMVGMVNMYVYMQTYYKTKEDLLVTELQNKALENELALQHLEKLKMQIRPHFLFNTLNALNGLILTQRTEKAEIMLSRLSALLQQTLNKETREFISLKEELNHVQLYMDIQSIRFEERLQYDTDIQMETYEAHIPFFIVQPILENAIKYSVEQTNKPIFISLTARVHQLQLQIEIRNTFVDSNNQMMSGYGIGLSNVTERLARYYKSSAAVNLIINDHGITRVEINLPYVTG